MLILMILRAVLILLRLVLRSNITAQRISLRVLIVRLIIIRIIMIRIAIRMNLIRGIKVNYLFTSRGVRLITFLLLLEYTCALYEYFLILLTFDFKEEGKIHLRRLYYFMKKHPFWATLGVIFLVLILAGGVTGLCGYFLGWYDNTDEETLVEDEDNEEDPGTRDSTEIDGQGLVVTTLALNPDQYEEYGVNPLASSAFTLTVTFKGTVYDRSLTWELSWDDSYTGIYEVTDYVELSDYTGEEVVLSCLQPFGYNIYVTVYRTAYPETSATCKLDYLASCGVEVSLSIVFSGSFDWWNCSSSDLFKDEFTYVCNYGVGTIKPEVSDFSLYHYSDTFLYGYNITESSSFLSYSALIDIYNYAGSTLEPADFSFDSSEVLDLDVYDFSYSTEKLEFDGEHFTVLNLSDGDPDSVCNPRGVFDSMADFTYAMDQTGHLNDTYFTFMTYRCGDEYNYTKLYFPISYDDTKASLSLNEGNIIFG